MMGQPRYGQGEYLHVLAGGFVDHGGKRVRVGLELITGLSGREGVSTATKNSFSIDGKVTKVGALQITEGLSYDLGKVVKFEPVHEPTPDLASCSLIFDDEFSVKADVNAVILTLIEHYHQGKLSGSCRFENGKELKLEGLDTFLIHD